MNTGVALIFFAILKTDGGGFHVQVGHDVLANFGHQVPKPVLFFHVQAIEAGYVATGSNHNVARCQGLRSRHGDPIVAGYPGVVGRSRAEEAGSHKVGESLRRINVGGLELGSGIQRRKGEPKPLLQFENPAPRSQTGS